MNTLIFNEIIDNFFFTLQEANIFIKTISDLAKYNKKSDHHLDLIATGGGNRINEGASNMHAHFADVASITAGISHRKFFYASEQFLKAIDLLNSVLTPEGSKLKILHQDAERFTDLFDSYLSQKTPKIAHPIIFLAERLDAEINTTIELLTAIRFTLTPNEIPHNDDSQISLILPEQFSLKNFAQRLLALQEIYSELCALFQVSEVDHPLRIIKLESGSLWALLIGNTKIIETMTEAIKNGASWIYKNYTTEGKISAIPMKVEAIDQLLSLSDRLEKSGIDTTKIKPNIEKAAYAISKELSILIEGQSNIKINNELISINSELEKNLIGNIRSPLLQSVAENKDPNK
ncbi:hypothetical protein JC796_18205 [Delftia acidovorans]|uniref:hypothetical protein n=1 Tax=Delftia acidovorans TaxID=80866 RepID=UPI0018E8709A|nr:hypothetical protein [Delftia acidovorans]MBJ2142677.1 hypothetical protein [Delftia acidovorans]